jgi:hypothetical protein
MTIVDRIWFDRAGSFLSQDYFLETITSRQARQGFFDTPATPKIWPESGDHYLLIDFWRAHARAPTRGSYSLAFGIFYLRRFAV